MTVKLPEELDAWIAAAAKELGVSKSALLRQCIEAARKKGGREGRKKPSVYDLTRNLCGVVKGTPRDLSRNPKYLKRYGE